MDLIFGTSHSWAIAVIRITLGAIFFAHGAQKVFGWFGGYGLKATAGFLTSVGLPLPVAYAVSFFELLAALAVITVMVGAIAKVHAKNGFFINWALTPGVGHGFEANLAYIAMAVACVIAGGGALSVDSVLVR